MSDKEKRKGNRYLREVGEKSRSGRTIIIMSKTGTKYYAPANQIKKVKRTPEEKGLWLNRKGDISTRNKPYCYDPKSQSYMRYWDKKVKIRDEYPKWIHMSREQCREYYARIWDLTQNDEDYKQWKEESKTLKERNDDIWWEEKKRREDEYDGRNDEYDYGL